MGQGALRDALLARVGDERWYAVWTRSQCEPKVEQGLQRKQMEVFLPLPFGADAVKRRGDENYNIMARLKPGVTMSGAQADVSVTAPYPYNISLLGMVVKSGNLSSTTTERVE